MQWEPRNSHAGINKDLTSSDQSAPDLDAEMDKILLGGLSSHVWVHPRCTGPPETFWQVHQFGKLPYSAGLASLKPVSA